MGYFNQSREYVADWDLRFYSEIGSGWDKDKSHLGGIPILRAVGVVYGGHVVTRGKYKLRFTLSILRVSPKGGVRQRRRGS